MARIYLAAALGLAAIGSLNAGALTFVGSGTLGASGLTSAYINTATAGSGNTTCIGSQVSGSGAFSGCATAMIGNGEKAYQSLLFSNTTPAVSLPSGSTLTAQNGVQFAKDADAAGGTTANNFWAATLGSDLVIPVGVYGVADIYTMLNDYWGANGTSDISVTFNWSSTSSWGNGGTTGETYNLTSGTEIRSAVDCATTTNCKTNGKTAGYQGESGEKTIGTGLGTSSYSNVSTSNVYQSPASTTLTGGGITGFAGYTGQTVTLNLDSQTFAFGNNHANDYLVSITIHSAVNSAVYGTGAASTGNSRAALSAVSFDLVTPEPSTVLSALTGLAALAFIRRRRKV